MPEKKTNSKCIACRGYLIEKIVQKFDASTGPLIIGTGSKNQYYEESEGFYCEDCGLKYNFIPKTK